MKNDSFFKKQLDSAETELKMLMDVAKTDNSSELEKWILLTKKHIETLLYNFVIKGCQEYGQTYGAFPELQEEYDTESEELLDDKIRVLSEIVKQGPDCNYREIDGFNDILEKKHPPDVETVTFY